MKDKLYNIVYNDIISKIKNGELKVGDKLPKESELTEQYGVSHTTTSRALKKLADINLIYRVKKAGTFVNGKLGRNSTLIIPVILPSEEDYNDIMKGVQSLTLTYNIFSPFYNSKNNVQKERDCLNEIEKYNIDGLIIYPCSSLANIDFYANILTRDIPIVCLDRNLEGITTPLVTTDNNKGIRQMVDRLVQMGHKKIGFFSINEQMAITEKERFKGFCSGIIGNKLALNPNYIFNTSDIRRKEINLTPKQQKRVFYAYIKENFEKYLALEDKPTAICCINDYTLNAVCKAAAAYNIRLPQDLMLASFDAPTKETISRGFLNFAQNFYELGRTAISLMLKILNGETYAMTEFVDGIMIE